MIRIEENKHQQNHGHRDTGNHNQPNSDPTAGGHELSGYQIHSGWVSVRVARSPNLTALSLWVVHSFTEGRSPFHSNSIVRPSSVLTHPVCNEIVMVVRSERIVSEQNGSNRLTCNPVKRGIE